MKRLDLNKPYDPSAIEQGLYSKWEGEGAFEPTGNGEPFCIVIPPPNVTGSLHMGHAFQDTIMDGLIRWQRMSGKDTLWQPGTDHAGIATQMVVERQLEMEGKTRNDFTRDEFTDRIWRWKEESGGLISRQLRRMGSSLDWSRERFTMDTNLSIAVRDVFIQLYNEGLIYRGKRLVNWDPILQTALSDLEVISTEESGFLWHLRYPIVNNSGFMVVATTRPETMLGDVAIAVHPEDKRYIDKIGMEIIVPLANRTIPIISDEYVDPTFGTGCVKITPGHDFNDYDVAMRHDLPIINVLNPDASIAISNSPYNGLDRYDARKKIISDLEQKNLIEKIETHDLMVPRGDRSQTIIEPYLTNQWFVSMKSLAEPAIQEVESGAIQFVPEHWSRTYFEWMRNIEDWCISRQILWGHRIPAWYDKDNNVFVAKNAKEAQTQAEKKHGQYTHLTQDNDVLDTWFSSALWPFSTLGWPDETTEYERFYPTNVLVTGFDIIFFWVARMIVFGLKFTGKRPFSTVYVHGLVRDANGQKMSKSKGNVLDPLDLIDGINLESLVKKRTSGLMQPKMAKRIEADTRKYFPNGIPAYGTDALRFTFASLATQGRDIRFDLGRVEGYRNFCNKLWNATRFVLINTRDLTNYETIHQSNGNSVDIWIKSKLEQIAIDVNQSFEKYRFDHVAQYLYSFVWDDFCNWYLEIAKIQLADKSQTEEQLAITKLTLLETLDSCLRLLHPIMPFITEALWNEVFSNTEEISTSIVTQSYPKGDPENMNTLALSKIKWVQDVISAIRTVRSEMKIEPRQRISVMLQDNSETTHKYMMEFQNILIELGRMKDLKHISSDIQTTECATILVEKMKICIPLDSAINYGIELSRLEREIQKLTNDLNRSTNKLENENFIKKAPTEIVNKEKERARDLADSLEQLKQQSARIKTLDQKNISN